MINRAILGELGRLGQGLGGRQPAGRRPRAMVLEEQHRAAEGRAQAGADRVQRERGEQE